MKKSIEISKNGYSFLLVPVEESFLVMFNSSIEARHFIDTHKHGTYEISNKFRISDCALEYRYFIIDTYASGFVLNPCSSSTFNECLSLIEHYM